MNPDPNHLKRATDLSKVNHSHSQVCWCGLAENQFISVKCKPSLRVTALGIRTLLSLFIEASLRAGGNFGRLPSCFHSNKHIGETIYFRLWTLLNLDARSEIDAVIK